MADFLDRLSEVLEARRDALAQELQGEATRDEATLERFVRAHWAPLPLAGGDANGAHATPAFAIDGSIHQENCDSGHYVFLAYAKCMGTDFEASRADIQTLPSATRRESASRFADLLQQSHELALACQVAGEVPSGSVIYLDGALYGLVPQLYPGEGLVEDFRRRVLEDYLRLLSLARKRGLRLVAVAKTSREAAHCRLWLSAAGDVTMVPDELSDAEMIHRWTDGAAGVSTPVILGRHGFTGGSRDLLDDPAIARSPAIVSFFVRLADYDDALRVDVPAPQLGADVALSDLDGRVLEGGAAAAAEVVRLLMADYGGPDVYNALLYSVDREVRLKRQQVRDIYLPVVEQQLGVTIRRNRSERRF